MTISKEREKCEEICASCASQIKFRYARKPNILIYLHSHFVSCLVGFSFERIFWSSINMHQWRVNKKSFFRIQFFIPFVWITEWHEFCKIYRKMNTIAFMNMAFSWKKSLHFSFRVRISRILENFLTASLKNFSIFSFEISRAYIWIIFFPFTTRACFLWIVEASKRSEMALSVLPNDR